MDNPIENQNNLKENFIDLKNITFDYIMYYYYKYGAIIVTILLIILIFAILIPFINLDYHADLCERIENLNKLCLYNNKDNNLPIKNTYLWNLCNYLYDYKDLDKQLKTKKPNVIDKNLRKLYEIGGDKVIIDDTIKGVYGLPTTEIDNENRKTQLIEYLKKIEAKFPEIITANDNINKLDDNKIVLNGDEKILKEVIAVIKKICSDDLNKDTFNTKNQELSNEEYKFFIKDDYDTLIKFNETFKFTDLAKSAKEASPPDVTEENQKLNDLATKINNKSKNTKQHLVDVFGNHVMDLYKSSVYTSYEEKQLHEELESLIKLLNHLQDTKKYLSEYHKEVEKLNVYLTSLVSAASIDLAKDNNLDVIKMKDISYTICKNTHIYIQHLDSSNKDNCDIYLKLPIDYNHNFDTEKEVISKNYSALDNWLRSKEDIINTNIGNIIISLNNNYEYYKSTSFVISIFTITLVIIIMLTGYINREEFTNNLIKIGFFLFFGLILLGIIGNTLYMQYSKHSVEDTKDARNWKKLILDKKDNTSEQGIIDDFIGFHGLTAPVILGIAIGYAWWKKRTKSSQDTEIKFTILLRNILFFILLLTIASYATLYGIFNETKNYNVGGGGEGEGEGEGDGNVDRFENKTIEIKETIYQLYDILSPNKYNVFLKPINLFAVNSFTIAILFALLLLFLSHFNEDFNFNTFLLYGSILIFVFFVIIVVFFGLSTKKFSEIYSPNDTICYAYIMTIRELDYLINEGNNNYIKNIFKSINSKAKIDNIILTDEIIEKIEHEKANNTYLDYRYETGTYNYIPLKLTSFDKNSTDPKLITLKNLQCLYNDKKLIKKNYNDGKNFNDNIDRIKEEIADVTRFKYAYIFLLTILLFILSKLFKYNFTYIAFSIIAIILICLFIYKIQNQLEA